MRDPRPVCLLCRSLAAGKALKRSPQWLSAASASTATGSATAAPARHDTPRLHYTEASAPIERPRRPQRSAITSSGASGPLAIFESVVRAQRKLDEPAPSSTSTPAHQPELGLQTYNDLAKLKEMIDHSNNKDAALETITNAYQLFRTDIYPALQAANYVPEIFRATLQLLLDRVFRLISKNVINPELPSLTEATLISRKLGILDTVEWSHAMRAHLEEITLSEVSPEAHATIDSYEGVIGHNKMLFHTVIQSWKLFILPLDLVQQVDPETPPEQVEFRLPEDFTIRRTVRNTKRPLYNALCNIFLHSHANSQLEPVIPLLVTTYVLFNDVVRCAPTTKAAAAPLLAAVAGVITRISPTNLDRELQQMPIIMHAYVKRRWADTIRPGSMSSPTANDPASTLIKRPHVINKGRKSSPTVLKDLDNAFINKDLALVEQVWLDFYGPEPQPPPRAVERLRQQDYVFNQFIMVYTAMRKLHRAAEVWNTMTAIGIPPSIRTYTSMMDGCKRSRNLAGLKNVWAQLVASKMKLDAHVWTARLSGLIECGKPELALHALEEMARLWKESQTQAANAQIPPAPHVVQPMIQPVNAVLNGLLRLDGLPAATKLLEWADRNEIAPDIVTYNTLLRTLIRRDDGEILNLFDMMKAQGIEPDDTTNTIMVDAIGNYISEMAEAARLEAVKRIIRLINGSSARPNVHAYAKLMYRLLVNEHGDPYPAERGVDACVNYIMSQVWSRGLEPPIFMYTILVGHYFSRNPPAVDKVRTLVDQHGLQNRPGVDHVFWERVISGYLGVPDVDAAFAVFEALPHANGLTLTTCERLLRALTGAGKSKEAAKLVRAVKADRDSAAVGSAGELRYMNHTFWDVAEEFGLYQG